MLEKVEEDNEKQVEYAQIQHISFIICYFYFVSLSSIMLVHKYFIVPFQESKKEETNKTNKNWKLKIGFRREESAVGDTNGWDIIFITVTSKGAVLLISYDAWCSEEMCVLL